jgi:VWFA-related protein
MGRRARASTLLAVALAVTTGAGSSASETGKRPDSVPVFGSRTGVVVLDLVVRDRKGHLVRDLRPDEVAVWENGVRQEVSSFRAWETPAAPATLAGAASTPAPTGVAVSVAQRRASPRAVSLVFDQLSIEGRRLAGESAARFVDAQTGSDAYLGVFRVDGRLKLVQGFTRDAESLKRSLAAATMGNAPGFASNVAAAGGQLGQSHNAGDPLEKGYDTRELRPAHHAGDTEAGTPMDGDGPLAAERGMADAMTNILRTAEEMERTQRGHWSLDSLLSLVHGQSTLPGRKTVVYFSEGLQVPPELEDALRSLVSEANRANVSIYGVDVRGLQPGSNTAAARELLDQAVAISSSQRLSGGNWHGVTREQAREFDVVEATQRMNTQATLEDLAKSTGGFLIAESNDLRPAFERLAEDMRDYYEVGYASTDDHYDGRFRRVTVKVSRPGASVQTREGYFAVPHEAARPVMGYEAPLLMALASGRPPRDVDHDAAVFRFDPEPPLVRLGLFVAVPLSSVSFAEDAAARRFAARVSIVALVKNARGDIVDRVARDSPIEGPLSEKGATRARRVTLSHGFAVGPGSYVVETAVHDFYGRRIGCRRLPLVVAPPSAGGVDVGDLVPLAGAVPVEAAAGEPGDPFRVGEARMTPRLEPLVRLAADDDGLVLFFVVRAAPSAAAPTAATLDVERDGRPVRHGTVALVAADATGRIRQVASVPTGTLPAGRYTLRLSVRQGSATEVRQIAVELPSRRPAAVALR